MTAMASVVAYMMGVRSPLIQSRPSNPVRLALASVIVIWQFQ